MRKSIFVVLTLFGVSNSILAQSPWYVGGSAGVCVSKTSINDTLANSFSTRNRIGGYGNVRVTYDMNRASSIEFSLGFLNTGYKINNDTMAYSTSVSKSISSWSSSLGISFRQNFSEYNFISEKFGVAVNYNAFSNATDTINNKDNAPDFRIIQTLNSTIYPMFYIGFAMGGKTDGGDRYEINLTYQQSFGTSHLLEVQHGEFYNQQFPLTFRGGNLQLGLSYFFNFGKFEKSEEYFYD